MRAPATLSRDPRRHVLRPACGGTIGDGGTATALAVAVRGWRNANTGANFGLLDVCVLETRRRRRRRRRHRTRERAREGWSQDGLDAN